MLTFEWEDEADLAPFFDAGWLIQEILDAVLVFHRDAIRKGVHADTGAPQPKLEGEQMREARKGNRPDVMGWTGRGGRAFPEALKRTKIVYGGANVNIGNKRRGHTASGTIEPGVHHHVTWLEREQARGGEFLYITGAVDKLIERKLAELLEVAITGGPGQPASIAELHARDARDSLIRTRG